MVKRDNFSEVVLYRKYRPKDFSEVLGQEHITKALLGALKQRQIAHAYLFAGPRGTGKTSVARILARGIGTDEGDIHEIDAASNRGVDDARDLREAVNTMPFNSPQKVYIIDEVHMLTKEAFNTLLKTLEEPPKHVIFILATTELEKVPETIISRCQTFQFRKPTQKILSKLALEIAEKEETKISIPAAELIALFSDGSFRDMHGILQKTIAVTGGKEIKVEDVEEVTGAPSHKLVNDVVKSIAECNLNSGLRTISIAQDGNVEIKMLLKLLLEKIRAVLILRFAKDMRDQIKEGFTEEDFAYLEKLSGNDGANINSEVLKVLLDASEKTRFATISSLPLELALIEIIGQK